MRWKAFEKEVAEYFGGLRRVRVSYNESVGDIIHPNYSIECKYGGQVPDYLTPRVPTQLTVGKQVYLLIPSRFLQVYKNNMTWNIIAWVHKKRNLAVFLVRGMRQAKKYNPMLSPVVCVKSTGRHGFVIVFKRGLR